MLITIRSRRLLKLFGWSRYGDRLRRDHEWPSYVQGSPGLWWRWFKHEWNETHGVADNWCLVGAIGVTLFVGVIAWAMVDVAF